MNKFFITLSILLITTTAFSKDTKDTKKGEDNITRINNTSISIIKRKNLFKDLVFKLDDISNDIKEEFYNYWSEENHSKTKMKYELERTWSMEKRLQRWINNSKKWNITSKNSKVETNLSAHQKAKEMILKMNNQ